MSISSNTLKNISLDCGWGKLLFGDTFFSSEKMATEMKKERKNFRNILLGVKYPQNLFAHNPQDFFLNPAYTYGILLPQTVRREISSKNFCIRPAKDEEDIQALNLVYSVLGMLKLRKGWFAEKPESVYVFVVEDLLNGKIIGGTVLVDHFQAYGDISKKCSLWALGIDPQTSYSGVGMALMRYALRWGKSRKLQKMILSVVISNIPAQKLYEKLGFVREQILTIKNKTLINQEYFVPKKFLHKFSPHIRGIVAEAQKRGIQVEQIMADFYTLTFGGRVIRCQESLSEMTNSILEKSCRDQKLFFHILSEAELKFPASLFVSRIGVAQEFSEKFAMLVVKSRLKSFVSDIITTDLDLKKNFLRLRSIYPEVLLQEFVAGDLYRFLVVDFVVVAVIRADAPFIIGDGKHTIRQLIQKLSRKKNSMTSGESKIPLDAGTRSMIKRHGYTMDTVLKKSKQIQVRRTANYHKGGTMVSVLDIMPKYFSNLAVKAAKKLKISVVEFEMIIPDIEQEEYFFLSGNPKPHLTYYPGKKAVKAFIDYLFPRTRL